MPRPLTVTTSPTFSNLPSRLLIAAWACILSGQTPPTLAIIHATVIDGTGNPPLTNRTVLIQNDRIVSVSPATGVQFTKSTQVVDASGKYLIPGLWDMHVHMRGSRIVSSPDFADENAALLPLYLANGVTGVREMGGDLTADVLKWRARILSGEQLGPRIVTCGPKLDGPLPEWPGSIAISTPAEARSAVRHVNAIGADFVKVYNEVPNIPRAAYLALLDEAKQQHLRVTGHVPLTLTVAEVSDAGQDIEHYSEYLAGCIRNERALKADLLADRMGGGEYESEVVHGYNQNVARALFSKFAANHTWVTPTLVIAHQLATANKSRSSPDPRLKYLTPRWLATWNDREEEADKLDKLRYRQGLDSVRSMQQLGVSLLAGSDTGASNPGTFPGFSLQDELAYLVQAGLTPMEALQCATLNAAAWLGRRDDLGTIEAGKLADLVLLDANPLRDIHNIRRIRAVVFNGKLLDRGRLDQMLAAVRNRPG
jgi:imidazolonepropionase-like amidohydrolase